MRIAERCVYRAKSAGLGQTAIFDAQMHARAVQQLTLETELRRAIERNEFTVHYQPIFRISDQRITGFEALVRWYHQSEG